MMIYTVLNKPPIEVLGGGENILVESPLSKDQY